MQARYGFAPDMIADYKGLRGDPSDNIPGVKGIGEKTATTLIAEFGSIEKIYETLKKHPEKLEKAGIKEGMIQKLKDGEEDAEFSKQLAMIRMDAPIDFILPKEAWKDTINVKTVEDILSRFEFRSLVPRVRQLVAAVSEHNVSEVRMLGDELFDEAPEQVPEDEFAKIALAVSVLDSNIAEPTLEDIYRAGRSRNF